jgi:hypothetical protein
METISVEDQILGFIGQAANSARDDFDRFGRWGVTPMDAPKVGEFVAGDYNLVYGATKLIQGVGLVIAGGAAEVTIPFVGQVGGTLAILYAGHQIGTGVGRMVRGAEQLSDALQHPTVHESPKQLLGHFLAGITPGGRNIESFLGGLP